MRFGALPLAVAQRERVHVVARLLYTGDYAWSDNVAKNDSRLPLHLDGGELLADILDVSAASCAGLVGAATGVDLGGDDSAKLCPDSPLQRLQVTRGFWQRVTCTDELLSALLRDDAGECWRFRTLDCVYPMYVQFCRRLLMIFLIIVIATIIIMIIMIIIMIIIIIIIIPYFFLSFIIYLFID